MENVYLTHSTHELENLFVLIASNNNLLVIHRNLTIITKMIAFAWQEGMRIIANYLIIEGTRTVIHKVYTIFKNGVFVQFY